MRLLWSPEARRDLAAQISFISERDTAAAERVSNAVESRAEWLMQWPGAGQRTGGGTGRSFVVRSTQLIVIYSATIDTITILRVRHTRQNWR